MTSIRQRQGCGRRGRRDGFTLLELLTVILIIGLLVSILLPAITAVIRDSYEVLTVARIMELSDGAELYHTEFSFYPGQKYPEQLAGSGGNFTGTQVLMACLWDYDYVNIGVEMQGDPAGSRNDNQPNPVSRFAAIRKIIRRVAIAGEAASLEIPDPRIFGTVMKGTPSERPNTFLDDFPAPLPILYYPMRIGKTAPQQAYLYNDNQDYVEDPRIFGNYRARMDKDAGWDITAYSTEMRAEFYSSTYASEDRRGASRPRTSDGEFLLIGPGPDRLYMTGDDVKSWKN